MDYAKVFENIKARYGIEDDDEDAAQLTEFFETQNQYSNKPMFTETGLQILEYMQTCGITNVKAKDIADGIDMTSRKVSGAIRKLVADGYVEKNGQNPVVYTLAERGQNFNIMNYKESLKE